MKPKLCTKTRTQRNPRQVLCSKTELADRVFLNRYLAIPVFLIILGGIFYCTFEIAEDFLTQPLAQLIHQLTDLLSLELAGSGIPVLDPRTDHPRDLRRRRQHPVVFADHCDSVFLPVPAGTQWLHGPGARILDRPMNRIGLPGKAILPLVTGFGCSVPAILAAGILPSRRDQKLTIAMIPFLSCSAKLPIYLILTQVFFPKPPRPRHAEHLSDRDPAGSLLRTAF